MNDAPLVLVVEDDRPLCNLLVYVLRNHGLRAEGTRTASQGITLAWEHRPDLVLMDVHLRGESGILASRRILERVDVPVVLVSGVELGDLLPLQEAAGAVDVLPKPFGLEEVVACVRRWSCRPVAA